MVILSVVRTHHSISKDSVHKCGFYTEERVLNTAFTRVQSLIVTAAHPLSLITRGHMSCRLFWASYLSQSLSDEECDQLRKEFVTECQVAQVVGHWQTNEICRILIKEEVRIPGNEEHYNQTLNDLEYQSDNRSKTVKQDADNSTQENSLTNAVRSITDSSTIMFNTLHNSVSLNSLTSTNVDTTINRTSIFVPGLHIPYNNSFSPGDSKQFHTIAIARRGESGYALVLNPAQKDIWLPDFSALNRSLRGDTVLIDKLTEKKGTVIANFSDHPKKYLVCFSDRRNRSLFIPIDKQYPKIDSLQIVEEDGLRIYHNHVDAMKSTNNYFTIKYQDIEQNVYLVWLNSSWTENYLYPKGVPVNCWRLETLSMSNYKDNDELLTKYINILKYNYIPAMLSNNGNIPTEIVDQVKQEFPEDWKIPNEERRKRKVHKDVFTIDDEDTVVLDDALSLEYDKDRNYIVNVHIADASYFVKPGSPLDRVASERGRTFYINYEVDRAMFMLPENICREHGSLNSGKERLVVTTQFVFSKEDYSLLGQLSDVEVHRSIVHSVCQLTKEKAGRLLLDKAMTHVELEGISTALFSKMKNDLSVLGKIATKLRKSQWPNSYLYEPDRGKQDKYTMAGNSLVEMFMCLCNTAIPAKLLKRDGQVGPVLVHPPIKHEKQGEWLESHQHLLKCCPLFKRSISIGGDKSTQKALLINQECWNEICNLTERSDGNSLVTYLCSLHNFPEMFVAYRQLCKCQSKSFYDIITNPAQASEYKHSHFNKIYTHFTSPLRRYCDLLVHRAVLGETSLPTVNNKIRQLIHTMNIHKWDEREFSRQRNMLCVTKCCRKEAKAIAVTVNVGKVTNKLMELHALPENQDFLLDRICEVKLSHLQAEGDKDDKQLMKWQIEMIPAPGQELKEKDITKKKQFNAIKVPLITLEKIIKAVHNGSDEVAKKLVKSCKTEPLKFDDVEQKKAQHSRSLTITKWIREYSKLDIQLSSTQVNSYAVEPTVSLIHISQTFSCCLLHVKHHIECYAPNILKYSPPNLFSNKSMSDYAKSWWPAVTAESINSSMSSKRIPVVIKNLLLHWTSDNEAQFIVTDYDDYRIRFQEPFSVSDYVCIQYRDLLLNPVSEKDFKLDSNRKVTWVVHGRIVHEVGGQIKIAFPENISPPTVIYSRKSKSISQKCDLEVIPLQVTFRYVA